MQRPRASAPSRAVVNLAAPPPVPVRARHWITRACAWGPGGPLLLIRTFALLLAAKLALQLFPVARVVAWKQRPLLVPPVSNPAHALSLSRRVRRAILLVARHAPLRFVCFPQCLAASELLRAYGIPSRLHYGVTRSPALSGQSSSLITHTWLEACGETIIGGEVSDVYSTLAIY